MKSTPPVQKHSHAMMLPIGFASVMVLMVLVTAIGVERMIENNGRLETIVTQHNAKTDLVMTMYTAARERSIALLSMVNMEDPFAREEKFEYFNELATRFALARIALSEKNLDEQELALLADQAVLVRRTIPLQLKVVDLLVADNTQAAVSTLIDQAVPAQDNVLAQLQTMLDYQESSAHVAFDEASEVVRRTTLFMVVLAFAAIALSAGIAYGVVRKSRRDEQALRNARETLEERVEERTLELSQAYDELQAHERQIELKNRTLEAVSTKLSKYLSPQVYASIFSGKQEVRLASHRKKLTIFFSDIARFTETTDRMESEDLTQLLNDYLTEMSRIALHYGATIDKYVGDAIVIFFGDPESRGVKADALACVEMAIAMQERMRELEHVWRASGIEQPLKCRIGINTGYCTVGNFGSEDRMDYTIIGGGVNLASRLETSAEPGEILISYETYAHVQDEIHCEEHAQLTVKGLAYPVATYVARGGYDKPGETRRLMREQTPNLKLDIDFDSMSSEQRRQAAEILQRALDQLSAR